MFLEIIYHSPAQTKHFFKLSKNDQYQNGVIKVNLSCGIEEVKIYPPTF
uniref:Uncharacterized protein n=1 Tax=Rhizophora mucronata TaxID=61149 RepID=A0A2P2MX28_RHIMU